jgi:SAM-dependent methyltransferase
MTVTACLRSADGALAATGDAWLSPATDVDHHALRRVAAPVLDIGCGPGRHVVALAELGIPALGIDVTHVALSTARARGALVLERSVFDRIPGAGRWGTALLLDGNLGIGADPACLLRRVAELVRPDGRIVVELAPPDTRTPERWVRFEAHGGAGPWFQWMCVAADHLDQLADGAWLVVDEAWCQSGRWFACLARHPATAAR